jgi:hypothetical protein
MASEAQIQANRLNAQKSTGPRTDEGKAVVAQNAVRHGLLAEQVVIRGEDPGEFEFYRERMLDELAPAGMIESMLAERAVELAWRLRRAERVQAEVFDTLLIEETTNPVRKLIESTHCKGDSSGTPVLGRIVKRDFGGNRTLERLGLYERRIEHSLYTTLNELQKRRLLRRIEAEEQAPIEQPPQEPTPQPPATEPATPPVRQTKPISALPGVKTPIEGQAKTQNRQFADPDSDRNAERLTLGVSRHRLLDVGIDRTSMAPARHAPGG